MKKLYFVLIILVVCFSSCNNNKTANLIEEKGKNEADLLQKSSTIDSLYALNIIDTNYVNDFISKALEFSEVYPESEMAPQILDKAGYYAIVAAQELNDRKVVLRYANDGILIFNKIQKVYPDYPGVKYCYYNRGIIYDNIVGDYASAEIEFRDFIHKYPNDELTESITAYLELIGKSEEEIAEKLQLNE